MYIESVPNRSSPPAILLRESYRQAGKVKKRTLANLSSWPPALVEGVRILLKGGTAVPSLDEAFDIVRSLEGRSCPLARRGHFRDGKKGIRTPSRRAG